jgi:hypothetical protein
MADATEYVDSALVVSISGRIKTLSSMDMVTMKAWDYPPETFDQFGERESHWGAGLLGLTEGINTQITMEFDWTRKIIKDITVVSPTTRGPPMMIVYGRLVLL